MYHKRQKLTKYISPGRKAHKKARYKKSMARHAIVVLFEGAKYVCIPDDRLLYEHRK